MTLDSLRYRFAIWLDRHHLSASVGLWLAVLFVITVAGLMASPAHAANIVADWAPPTANTDGTAIPATGAGSLVSHRVEWGTCSGTAFGTKIAEAVVNMPAVTFTVPNVAPGTYCLRVFAKNTFGSESSASGVASKVVPAPVPNPPTTVVATLAYELKQTGSGVMLGRLVGTVPLGTACVGSEPQVTTSAGNYYAVPSSAVTFSKTPRLPIVALCAATG